MPSALYISTIQIRPNPGDPGLSHLGEVNIQEDTPMHDPSSGNADNPSSTGRAPKPTVMTKLQQRKRVGIAQPKDPSLAGEPEIPSTPKGKTILLKKKSQKKSNKDIK